MYYFALIDKFGAKITEHANYFSDYIAFSTIVALTLQWASLTQPAPNESPGRERNEGN